MENEIDVEAPRCPSCKYELTGLRSLVCPECGTQLEADFERYRPSVAGKVAKGRAVAIALVSTLITIFGWAVIRDLTLAVYFGIVEGRDGGMYFLSPLLSFQRRHWLRQITWESCSFLRLWVLFGAVTVLLGGRDTRMALRRLMLFAPWMALLDGALLISGLLLCKCVPEPATLWPGFDWADLRFWVIRSAIPGSIVGYIYLRRVLRWRPVIAAPLAPGFIPLVSLVSAGCANLYLRFGLNKLWT
jgi:hypothetical protein